MGSWMLNCRELTELVCASMDRKIPLSLRLQMKMHLFMCKYCSRFARQMHTIRDLSRIDEDPLDAHGGRPCLSAEAAERIRRSLSSPNAPPR